MNPASGEDIPIWVADYVLGSYGSGAIMAVPGHDSRDFDFAEAFDLAVKRVVQSPTEEKAALPFYGTPQAWSSCPKALDAATDLVYPETLRSSPVYTWAVRKRTPYAGKP